MNSLNYLESHHFRILQAVDALDSKIAQQIAVNGLVLSFVFDKAAFASSTFVFYAGILAIILGLVIALYSIKPNNFKDSPKPRLYLDKSEKEIPKALRQLWVSSLEENIELQRQKATLFTISLYLSIVGLISLVVGYYV